MAIREFRLPDPGEGLVEADIVTWRVAVGDTVKLNDIVVEVETSKSLVELPSPYAGTVRELLVAEGDTVDVGTPIIAIDDGAGRGASAAARTIWSRTCRRPRWTPRPTAPTVRRPAGGCRCWSATGRRPPRPSGGRASRAGFDRSGAGSKRTPSSPAPSPPTRRCRGGPTSGSRCRLEPARPVGGPLPGPGATVAEPLVAGGCGAGQAAGPQAGQGSRGRSGELTGSGPGGVITRDDVQQSARDRARRCRSRARRRRPRAPSAADDTASRSRACARPPPRPWCRRPSPLRTSASG